MKELSQEKVEIVSEIEVPDEVNHGLIGTFRQTIDGGSFYEYDVESGTIGPCDWEYDEELILGAEPRKKVVVKQNCIYVEALNKKNAVRKLKKGRYLFHTIKK